MSTRIGQRTGDIEPQHAGTVTPGTPSAPSPRVWSAEMWRTLAASIIRMTTGGGETGLSFTTKWLGDARWARNRINTSGDQRNNTLTIERVVRGARQALTLNELDDPDLRGAVATVEEAIQRYRREPLEYASPLPFRGEDYLHPTLWFAATYDLDGTLRAHAAEVGMRPAERAGMVSAGYLEATAAGVAVYRPTQQMALYYPVTEVQYSLTVRDLKGTGSGWAGVNGNDWTKIDAAKLSAVALDKCLTSRNPVAIEPGRYTAILEPQAVGDLVKWILLDKAFDWDKALNNDRNKYHDPRALIRTKIGQRLLSDRLSIRADPMDPELGFVPFDPTGEPYRPAIWFEHGVLKRLPYNREFAVKQGLGDLGVLNSYNFRLDGDGPTVTIDEMIATTKRGFLVTRFSNVGIVDPMSLLCEGFTRDGLWLVENGKISRPAKNFRFVESPLLALNRVEQIGTSQRVFWPGYAAVVPPLKINDFAFASLIDAI